MILTFFLLVFLFVVPFRISRFGRKELIKGEMSGVFLTLIGKLLTFFVLIQIALIWFEAYSIYFWCGYASTASGMTVYHLQLFKDKLVLPTWLTRKKKRLIA